MSIEHCPDDILMLHHIKLQAGYDEDSNLSSGNIKYFEAPPSQEFNYSYFLVMQVSGIYSERSQFQKSGS